ncbi:MAG: D-2-hydroxyacid dehydrogenase [Rhizobiales bacterium]|nr:D-2-hydroxyacid dehydrogenase [Hyphomicrobiales bacterium]
MADAANGRPTIKVLVENDSNLGPVFAIDPERIAAAKARHSDVAAHISVAYSKDCDRFADEIADADVLIGWVFPHAELPRRAPRLRWVHLTGAGVEHLAPFDWVPQGVVVTNNRGVHAPKTREFGALAALMIANRMPQIAHQQRNQEWVPVYSGTVEDLTAGIVGVGQMGGAVASACKDLGMRVLGIRRGAAPHDSVDRMWGMDGLDALLGESDVVFLCTPLTPQTRGLIGARQLARMKRGAGLVNIARGAVVDTEALRAALTSGQLSGAVLDVFDPEPLPEDSPLWDTPNLIITPHCSSDDAEAYVPRTLDLVFENLRRLLAGKDLLAVVDPRLGY